MQSSEENIEKTETRSTMAVKNQTHQAENDAEALGAFFRAVSDPNRLRILRILIREETTEKVLVARLMAPQPRIARHIAYLKRHGIIRVRREGRYAICSLSPDCPYLEPALSFLTTLHRRAKN